MSYKFIIDTNVLRENFVNKLRDSGLIEACHSGRFAFYVTPVLLKERSDFLLNGSIPKMAESSFKFLLSIKWQRFFNDLNGPEGIYTLELEGNLPSEYLFIPSLQVWQIRENLELVLQGGELGKEVKDEVQRDKDRWAIQKQQNFITYKSMREESNKHLRNNPSLKRKDSKFSDFRDGNFEKTAIGKIKKSISSQMHKDNLIEYWKKNRNRCLYFNKFIEGQLYQAWYAMAKEEEPRIKSSDYEDIEHLVYLNSVDGIVSNEAGFMRDACRELFPEKDIFSIDEFIEKVSPFVNV